MKNVVGWPMGKATAKGNSAHVFLAMMCMQCLQLALDIIEQAEHST